AQTVCHLYAAPVECDLLDAKAWKAANPAMGKFRDAEDVRRQAEEANRMPSAESKFRNLILNQRVEARSPFVSRNVW
ncbi:terminase large subunit, partial [Salmonella enterica subsp. enterica serovar Oranienburg]|nr:terminase large subunit [Salmonella enterica subsp. enterica serovar Oranienburg]